MHAYDYLINLACSTPVQLLAEPDLTDTSCERVVHRTTGRTALFPHPSETRLPCRFLSIYLQWSLIMQFGWSIWPVWTELSCFCGSCWSCQTWTICHSSNAPYKQHVQG